MKRETLLRSLIKRERPTNGIVKELAQFPWDSETALQTVTVEDGVSVLRRFLIGELNATDLEDWANAIEGREDLEYGSGPRGQVLKRVIVEMANPTMYRQIDRSTVQDWLTVLKQ
jgi:hypothetical protein